MLVTDQRSESDRCGESRDADHTRMSCSREWKEDGAGFYSNLSNIATNLTRLVATITAARPRTGRKSKKAEHRINQCSAREKSRLFGVIQTRT